MKDDRVQLLFEDMTFNSRIEFLEEGKDDEELSRIGKKRGLELPSPDLAIFKCIYALVDIENKNRCTLPLEEVDKALQTLIGKAIDIDHYRKKTVGHWIDSERIKQEIISYGAFWKNNFPDEYDIAKKRMIDGELKVSFEAFGDRRYKDDISYDLLDIHFAGGALLDKEKPAFDRARVLEFAKVMEKGIPSYFERAQTFNCECIKCGNKITTDKHCADLKCPKCGGQMRRAERPGPGQGSEEMDEYVEELAKKENITDKELGKLPKEVTDCVKKKTKAGSSVVEAVKSCWKEYKSKGYDSGWFKLEELSEFARFYLSDLQGIIRLLGEVDCLSCKEKGMIDLLNIDFENNKTKIKCINCGAIMSVDLTPKPKLVKKGRKIKKITQDKPVLGQDKMQLKDILNELGKESDELIDAILEKFEETDEELEMALAEILEGEVAKKMTYQQRKALPDSSFAVVKTIKGPRGPRKIRMYPIHDKAHVRNALARLGQPKAQATLKRLGVSIESVRKKILRRARELKMTSLLERYKKGSVDEVLQEIAKPVLERELSEVELKSITDKLDNKEEITENELKTMIGDIKKVADEAKKKADADAKKKADEDAKKKADEDAKKKAKETANKDLEDLKKKLKDAEDKVAGYEKAERDAKIKSRRDELGDFAKDVKDEELLDDEKFENLKIKKENARLKDVVKKAKEDGKITEEDIKGLEIGSTDKDVDDEIKAKAKRVNEIAFPDNE